MSNGKTEAPAPASQGLAGQRVVVTRARNQGEEFSRLLREQGAEVLEVPCIKIAPPTEREPLVEALAGLGCYDWLIFTSANGVTGFFTHFFRAFHDLRDLGAVRIAAVGPATTAQVEALHLQVEVMPKRYVGREIAEALVAYESIENLRILLVRAEVASPDLPRLLEERGAIVDDVACYRTLAETEDWNGHAARLEADGAEWVTFTSGSTVRHFHDRFNLPALVRRFPAMRLATIGPETTQALKGLGLTPTVQAKEHTLAGLTTAVSTHTAVARAENRAG